MSAIDTRHVAVLKVLKEKGYEAIIAGGMLRDVYFDQPYRDIDIFIWDPRTQYKNNGGTELPLLDMHAYEKLFSIIGLSGQILRNWVPGQGGDEGSMEGRDILTSGLTHVCDMMINGFHYQFITLHTNPVEYVMKYFDTGICKVYCDGEKIRYTNDFLKDAENKTITICGRMTEDEFIATMERHIPKLISYYPSFTVMVAPHLEQYWKNYKSKIFVA